MSSEVGAAWAHGGLPPWMEQPPWFDEAIAADREQDAAAVAALIDERFGSFDVLAAERDRPPRFQHRPRPAPVRADRSDTSEATHTARRAALERALHQTDHPAAETNRRAA